MKPWIEAIRVRQWVKNLLVFGPVILAHRAGEWPLLGLGVAAFLAFSLGASAIYVLNDRVDVEADRKHPRKRLRPFASGALPLHVAPILSAFLLLAAAAISLRFLSPAFLGLLVLYAVASVAYSLWLKKHVIVDVLVLAGFYVLRVFAGSVATGVEVSIWFLDFSLFFFLSMAFVKRYSEVARIRAQGEAHAAGRGYLSGDLELLRILGPASGYLSVLVLALYINGQKAVILYQRPVLLWLLGPLLIYWLTRVWILAHRGELADDPIAFSARDPVSYGVALLGIALFSLAA